MIGTYVFIILVRIEKNCWRSLTHVENWYVCTRGFGVCFMLQTNKAVVIRWLQPQLPQKVMTSIYVIRWKLLFHSTILFSPFPHAYKAKLTKFTPMIQIMLLKLSGGGGHG